MATKPTYYAQKLEIGQSYQDFIAEHLYLEGIVVINFQTRAYQRDHGENMLGLEIKKDEFFRSTGRFWIEVAEKGDPSHPQWVSAGIERDDNSWLYGIGDEFEFFIFSKKVLRRYLTDMRPEIHENHRRTSRGFFLPRAQASELAERAFVFGLRTERHP